MRITGLVARKSHPDSTDGWYLTDAALMDLRAKALGVTVTMNYDASKPVGTVVEASLDENGLLVTIEVPEDEGGRPASGPLIGPGSPPSLSIGPEFTKEKSDGWHVTEATLKGFSLVTEDRDQLGKAARWMSMTDAAARLTEAVLEGHELRIMPEVYRGVGQLRIQCSNGLTLEWEGSDEVKLAATEHRSPGLRAFVNSDVAARWGR